MHDARRIGLYALFLTSFSVPLACGNKPDAKASFSLNTGGDAGAPAASSATPCQPGQPCTAENCQPGQPCPAPSASASTPAPLGSVFTNDPNALAGILAAAAAAGSAWLGPAGAGAAIDPAEAGLRAAAAKFAPGMSPEGQVAKGNLAEGGHIVFMANMDPSRCYTVVAFGAGMADLDVNLLAPPLYNFLAGQDGMAGPTAVIGASPKPMCPIIPVTVAYKVDLFAKKGTGPVAAQLYSKPK